MKLTYIRRVAAVLVGALLLAACSADDPATAPAADLLLNVDVGIEGVRDARVEAILAPGPRDLAPGALGALEVHWVDADSGEVLARGRVPVDHVVMAERFEEDGTISGEPLTADVVPVLVRLPRPPSGRGRATFRWRAPGGELVVTAHRVEVPREGTLPIAATEIEPVDDLSAPLTATSPDGGVAAGSAALHDGSSSEHCGNGELEEDLYYIGGYVGYVGEHCDDGNTDDGDGCSSDCRFELEHVGGAPADSNSLTVVFIPAGWGDLDAFREYMRWTVEHTLASDWYDENAEKLSFWALDAEEVDELGGLGCNDVGGVAERAAELRDAMMGGRYDGELRAHRPLQPVVSPPSACRSWALGRDVVLLGSAARTQTLAHELGHSIGGLADEYSYGAEGRACNGADVNVAVGEPVPWACLAENLDGARCPDGSPVHTHTVGTGCDTVTTPCRICAMRTTADFCPVCYRQMDAAFAGLLGSGLDESCNGADDDLNGVTDDGCDCATCAPSCDTRQCGNDGCFGDCGGCGLGEGCRENACVAGCDTSCRTATGADVCDGEPGIFWCGSGLVTRCTCDAGGIVDCSPCISVGCGECGAGQACHGDTCVDACPAGLTSCYGTCVDTDTDPTHCGACGSSCPAGEACSGGTCEACPAGMLACAEGCVDQQTDEANCGGCGTECASWQQCRAGACTACPSGASGVTDCDGICVDVSTDAGNCGACGNECGGGSECVGGRCQCEEGRTACGGECVDTRWDRRHCGGCGVACGAGQDCRGGACSDCAAGDVLCDWSAPGWSFCTDLEGDTDNCGACGRRCADGQTCAGGVCS